MRLFPLLMIGLVAATPAVAAPCTPASVSGIWSLASIRAEETGVEDFYKKAPNEVMRFTASGSFMYVASTGPFTAADAGPRLDAADARDMTSYRYMIGPTGGMLIVREGKPFQAFQCLIADRAENGAKAGDMILSNMPGLTMLRRIQRKLR